MERLRHRFDKMIRAMHHTAGATFSIELLTSPEASAFTAEHADILDDAISRSPLSPIMRRRLSESNYIFSGIKTFHELKEAFPELIDEEGNRKPFERFLSDVRKIDETYNRHYLRAEYDMVQASAEMAARWEQISEDGDAFDLQYRTAGDEKVREEHARLDGVTLPPSAPFWDSFYPPNGWGCRCTVVQVRRGKYPHTDPDEALSRGNKALERDRRGIFRFNPGKTGKAMPDYNPYTISRCRSCDIAKGDGKTRLAAFIPDNELCAACEILHKCVGDRRKSQRAIERTHYMHEMEPLLSRKVEKAIEGGRLNVGFTKDGNKHLFADTFGRTRIVSKDDLKNLATYLKNAEYVDDSALTHPRTDNIEHFYYFKVQMNDQWVRLNVAKHVNRRDNGHIIVKYFLYSINDIVG